MFEIEGQGAGGDKHSWKMPQRDLGPIWNCNCNHCLWALNIGKVGSAFGINTYEGNIMLVWNSEWITTLLVNNYYFLGYQTSKTSYLVCICTDLYCWNDSNVTITLFTLTKDYLYNYNTHVCLQIIWDKGQSAQSGGDPGAVSCFPLAMHYYDLQFIFNIVLPIRSLTCNHNEQRNSYIERNQRW